LQGPEWSFEHVRKGRLGAWARTTRNTLRPHTLWRELSDSHPVKTQRVAGFLFSWLLIGHLAAAALGACGILAFGPSPNFGLTLRHWDLWRIALTRAAWPYRILWVPSGPRSASGVEWTMFFGVTLFPALLMPLLVRGPGRGRALAYSVPSAIIAMAAATLATSLFAFSLDQESGLLPDILCTSLLAAPCMFPLWLGWWWAVFLDRYQARERPVRRAVGMTLLAAACGIAGAIGLESLLVRLR
jgi:hypothetical protein